MSVVKEENKTVKQDIYDNSYIAVKKLFHLFLNLWKKTLLPKKI
jgi:hypothetical protein